MAVLTDEQKEGFLDLTRRGWNRGAAAQEIGSTGTKVGRMLKEDCANYDHEFAMAYHDAVAHAEDDGTAPLPRETEWSPVPTTTLRGYTKWNHLAPDDLDHFIEAVEDGIPRDDAARSVGTSLSQINRLALNDNEFAERLRDAYEVGHPAYVERLRATAYQLGVVEKDYKALRDLLIVHAPEYSVLRTTRHEVGGVGGGSIELLVKQVLPDLPMELLDLMIERIEAGQEIQDVIDAIPNRQLPPATAA